MDKHHLVKLPHAHPVPQDAALALHLMEQYSALLVQLIMALGIILVLNVQMGKHQWEEQLTAQTAH